MQNLPNAISIGRLLAVPFVVWFLIAARWEAAFWVFLVAAASDAVDGFIAKQFGMASALGSYLDPLADKALLVSVYLTLGIQGALPDFLVILVVFRDILIVAGAVLYYGMTQAMLEADPHPLSKINTAAQIVLVAVVLGGPVFGVEVAAARDVLIYLAGFTTLLSGGVYVIRWFRTMDGLG